MLSRNIFYLVFPSPDNVIKIFLSRIEIYYYACGSVRKILQSFQKFLHTLSVYVSISIPLDLLYPNPPHHPFLHLSSAIVV